jgi:hypothetical protein
MKKLTLLALSLVTAGAALAESPTPDNTASHVFAHPKTRAQVQAELKQARADGSIKVWSTQYNPLTVAKSTMSRADVQAAVETARASGELSIYAAEDSGSTYLARAGQPKPADAVFASLPQAQ